MGSGVGMQGGGTARLHPGCRARQVAAHALAVAAVRHKPGTHPWPAWHSQQQGYDGAQQRTLAQAQTRTSQ
jgi:hypothetical protein